MALLSSGKREGVGDCQPPPDTKLLIASTKCTVDLQILWLLEQTLSHQSIKNMLVYGISCQLGFGKMHNNLLSLPNIKMMAWEVLQECMARANFGNR